MTSGGTSKLSAIEGFLEGLTLMGRAAKVKEGSPRLMTVPASRRAPIAG